MTTGLFLILAWLFYKNSNEFLTNYFLGAGIICAIVFPVYSRWRYKQHYRKHVNTNFSKSFGHEASVEFLDEHFLTKDDFNSESKVSNSQIESINELPEHFLIRLNNGQCLILPKHKIAQLEKLRAELLELGKKIGHELTDNTNWKWK